MNSKTRGKKEVLINVFEVVSKERLEHPKNPQSAKIIPHFSHRNELQDLELSGPFSAARLHEY